MNSNVLVARKARSLTQEQLAKAVGCNHSDVVRVEKHGWIPPAPVRERFAKALATPEEQLFGVIAIGEASRP